MSVRLAHGLGEAPRSAPVRAVVALGANLGQRAATLEAAIDELRRLALTSDVRVSTPIETVAVTLQGEDEDAPRYLNAVAVLQTGWPRPNCSPRCTASKPDTAACVGSAGAIAPSISI